MSMFMTSKLSDQRLVSRLNNKTLESDHIGSLHVLFFIELKHKQLL